MSEAGFASPLFLHALWLVPVLTVVFVLARRARDRALRRFAPSERARRAIAGSADPEIVKRLLDLGVWRIVTLEKLAGGAQEFDARLCDPDIDRRGELLADGRGVLVPFGDAAAIGNEIAALLTDDPRRRGLMPQCPVSRAARSGSKAPSGASIRSAASPSPRVGPWLMITTGRSSLRAARTKR